jgi:hypothetical protein
MNPKRVGPQFNIVERILQSGAINGVETIAGAGEVNELVLIRWSESETAMKNITNIKVRSGFTLID